MDHMLESLYFVQVIDIYDVSHFFLNKIVLKFGTNRASTLKKKKRSWVLWVKTNLVFKWSSMIVPLTEITVIVIPPINRVIDVATYIKQKTRRRSFWISIDYIFSSFSSVLVILFISYLCVVIGINLPLNWNCSIIGLCKTKNNVWVRVWVIWQYIHLKICNGNIKTWNKKWIDSNIISCDGLLSARLVRITPLLLPHTTEQFSLIFH